MVIGDSVVFETTSGQSHESEEEGRLKACCCRKVRLISDAPSIARAASTMAAVFLIFAATALLPTSNAWCIFFCSTPPPKVAETPTDGCGITPISPETQLIVGGTPAIPHSWPWQAEICTKRKVTKSTTSSNGENVFKETEECALRCGGSLIDNQWILTAGHCVVGTMNRPNRIGVKLGIYDRNSNDERSILVGVTEIIRHPDWGFPYANSNDIALLRLETAVEYTKHIRPVCIPRKVSNKIQGENTAYVTGWGRTSEGGSSSSKLRQVSVSFLNKTLCEQEYRGEIDETMECASKPGHDSCQGDSGGPLVTKLEDGRWYQAGIVSWGDGCADSKHAGVYARTSAFCDFIKDTVGHDLCSK